MDAAEGAEPRKRSARCDRRRACKSDERDESAPSCQFEWDIDAISSRDVRPSARPKAPPVD